METTPFGKWEGHHFRSPMQNNLLVQICRQREMSRVEPRFFNWHNSHCFLLCPQKFQNANIISTYGLNRETYFIIVNSNQEKKWCIAPVYNFVVPMLNKRTLLAWNKMYQQQKHKHLLWHNIYKSYFKKDFTLLKEKQVIWLSTASNMLTLSRYRFLLETGEQLIECINNE